jgi:type I site-specific restriction-modification system R (restriction) subunit
MTTIFNPRLWCLIITVYMLFLCLSELYGLDFKKCLILAFKKILNHELTRITTNNCKSQKQGHL